VNEIADFFVKIGVTGPAALGFLAAGWMMWTYVRNYQNEIETKVKMATSFNELVSAIKALKEQLDRLENKVAR
jgi:hypothetical protein